MPGKYDVVVVGAGPVGLMFSACLARLGPYKIKHIDNRAEPTPIGRADGIQARTLDVLDSMGLKGPIWAFNPGLIYEVAFWGATPDGQGVQRIGTTKSYPDHVDTRHPFTTALHQGRIEGVFLDDLRSRGVEVQRPWTIRAVTYRGPGVEYPVDVELVSVDGTAVEKLQTKYLFGADGAHSAVRKLLSIPMIYKDPTVHVWSVIDGVVETDFPDIQIKCTVRTPRGSCMVIPQGNNRIRFYVQISPDESKNFSACASSERIQRMANEILSPYRVEWVSVDWYSAYHIGQGISQKYTLDNRIFIGGDACHTHSPKAGQGMNYGLLDAHNLSWKLHLVESNLMRRELLHTYEEERHAAASRLIEFDATYAGLFSSHNPSQQANDEFVRIFKENSLLTSGYGVEYTPSTLTVASHNNNNPITIPSQRSLQPGRSFPPTTVTRVIDAHDIPLERDVPFNGSFNIYIFAGKHPHQHKALTDLSTHLTRRNSLFSRIPRATGTKVADLSYESRHNPHSPLYTFSIIFNAVRASVDITSLPPFFQPYRYHIYSDDARRQPGGPGAAHRKLGFGSREGGVVVVRPDGYVGCVLGLVGGRATGDALEGYFGGVVPGGLVGGEVRSML
ncbi:FAD/NAD(P)-binding domain-containing protein [Aspergillus candidus]|uniref:FAD/NAD(P)-binding domain-containing protein n=1 Tax=Aspergillus candidus TaxID=41067 RepID=A0A2I2F9Y1_ASPCN|nr:FAD/NAD(P)-binding domain-containing protein [Aspergillus candidus]PLB37431.1 FAD/NAD(P)-binding domain-containing protein [Aspergillus candidus]